MSPRLASPPCTGTKQFFVRFLRLKFCDLSEVLFIKIEMDKDDDGSSSLIINFGAVVKLTMNNA